MPHFTYLDQSSTVADISGEPILFSNDAFHDVSQGLVDRRSDLSYSDSEDFETTPDLPPPTFVRALYDYDGHDGNCLSLRTGDIIQVIVQLESGWWDGVINDVRGWFPSNFTQIISSDEAGDTVASGE